jgi:hypothetical protein
MSQLENKSPALDRPINTLTSAEWAQIREALSGLRFGAVNIVVQDGVVVQIDRLEKRRMRKTEVATRSK